MARVSGFLYCLNTERNTTPDGKGELTNAIGVLSTITPEYIPGLFSFSIIFSIIDIDLKSNNRIRISFADDNKKEIVNSGEILLNLPTPVEQLDIPNEYKGLNLCMDMRNVALEKDGVYRTTIFFNDETLGCYEIYVKGRNKK